MRTTSRATRVRSSAPHAHRDPLILLGIVLTAWAARILFLLCQPDAHAPTSLLYWGDAQTYLQSAMASMRGVPWDSGIPFHPPGFTTFLAGLLRLVGAPSSPGNFDALALKIVLALLGAVTVGIFYLIAQRLAGRTVALAALPLAIFSFGHCVQSTSVNVEGTFLPLELAFVLGAIELAARLRGDVSLQSVAASRREHPRPAPGASSSPPPSASSPAPPRSCDPSSCSRSCSPPRCSCTRDAAVPACRSARCCSRRSSSSSRGRSAAITTSTPSTARTRRACRDRCPGS